MADSPDIRISVTVDGEGVAPALEEVAESASSAAESAQRAGNESEDAADKAKRLGQQGAEGLADFHKKGETLIKSLVAEFNPALAQSLDLTLNFAEGVTRVDAALLKWAAGGLAIGGILYAVSALTAEQTRLEEATRKATDELQRQRDKAGDVAAEWAERLNAAGLPAGTAQVGAARRTEQALNQRGTVDALARNAALAQLIGELDEQQVEQFVAGLVMGGGRPVEFAGNREADTALIQRVLAGGASEEARARLRARRASDLGIARRETESEAALGADVRGRAAVDVEIEALRARQPEITDEQARFVALAARRVVDGIPIDFGRERIPTDISIGALGRMNDYLLTLSRPTREFERAGRRASRGASEMDGSTLESLLTLADDIAARATRQDYTAGPSPSPITINVYQQNEHVAAKYQYGDARPLGQNIGPTWDLPGVQP